jgi:hypothetical protein
VGGGDRYEVVESVHRIENKRFLFLLREGKVVLVPGESSARSQKDSITQVDHRVKKTQRVADLLRAPTFVQAWVKAFSLR